MPKQYSEEMTEKWLSLMQGISHICRAKWGIDPLKRPGRGRTGDANEKRVWGARHVLLSSGVPPRFIAEKTKRDHKSVQNWTKAAQHHWEHPICRGAAVEVYTELQIALTLQNMNTLQDISQLYIRVDKWFLDGEEIPGPWSKGTMTKLYDYVTVNAPIAFGCEVDEEIAHTYDPGGDIRNYGEVRMYKVKRKSEKPV